MSAERESMECDVLIIGAGPAGLSAAIRLGQLAKEQNRELSIYVLEKGAYVGAHTLSGAVLDPKALNELIPDWKTRGAPVSNPVTQDSFYFLSEKHARKLPTLPEMKNKGNYIISLENLCKWMGEEAEKLGVNIFPGYPAHKTLWDCDEKTVVGVQTQDMGRDKNGEPGPGFQPGVNIYAKHTLFAEGCRGSLTEVLIRKFNLRKGEAKQTYGIGIKELWNIPPEQHKEGTVIHTAGWPLDSHTYGGSFIYHLEDHKVALGFVIGLDYQNPYLDPFQELQRFKTHPMMRKLLAGGECIQYGARALNEGGFQSVPKLSFPGGSLIGCGAGFLNVPRIKGTHTAMKSGMIAAETLFNTLPENWNQTLEHFDSRMKKSWIYTELFKARNVRPAFQKGFWAGILYSAIDQFIFRGHAPWTLEHKKPDHRCLKPAAECSPINYPKPDNVLTFSKTTQLSLSGVSHNENQPCHLKLKNATVPMAVNFPKYAGPEQHYCPANVYEYVTTNDKTHLQINFSNCVHCKTCDIKDPKQNILWTTPEGGDGPHYTEM